jgi:Tfp pilus assembly protein PilN
MRAVNLLPRDVQRSGLKPTAPVLTGVVGAIVVTTALCAGFLLQSAKVAEKRNELDAARAELALVPPPAPQQADNGAAGLAAEEAQRVIALQAAITGRVAWDRILREVSLVLPKDVWVSSLSLNAPQPGEGVTARQFSISGNAYSHEGVARLLSRIALIPDLANVQLGGSNRLTPGEKSTVSWSITARIREPGSAT